ncbi:hypothetical protein [Actinoplanes sp. TFC3]|uniref:hypothetical protein n=1 Tax=Actinoplanes sp. TFC3 TaxID=1710355 RepID=UPI001F27A090|nr:hypothetical protein [Actinoplanes sp. TFC3]
MFTRQVPAGLLAASVLLAAGCSADKETSVPASPPPVPSSAPSIAGSAKAEQDALVAYRGLWNAFVEAGKTSDAESAGLRTYASGNALKLIVSSLYTDKELGKITKGEVALQPKVVKRTPEVSPAALTIEDCVDATRWLEYKASGGLWDDKPGGKHRNTAIIKKQQDGAWRVDAFALRGSGTC